MLCPQADPKLLGTDGLIWLLQFTTLGENSFQRRLGSFGNTLEQGCSLQYVQSVGIVPTVFSAAGLTHRNTLTYACFAVLAPQPSPVHQIVLPSSSRPRMHA